MVYDAYFVIAELFFYGLSFFDNTLAPLGVVLEIIPCIRDPVQPVNVRVVVKKSCTAESAQHGPADIVPGSLLVLLNDGSRENIVAQAVPE